MPKKTSVMIVFWFYLRVGHYFLFEPLLAIVAKIIFHNVKFCYGFMSLFIYIYGGIGIISTGSILVEICLLLLYSLADSRN